MPSHLRDLRASRRLDLAYPELDRGGLDKHRGAEGPELS